MIRLMLAIVMSVSVLGIATSSADQALSIERLIEDVSRAYRTDRLEAAQTIRLTEDRRLEFPGHDYGSIFHDLTAQRRHYVLDFSAQSASTEYLTEIANTNYHARSVLKDGNLKFIDYAWANFEDQGEVDFLTRHGATIRSSAPLLAMWLKRQADTASYAGEKVWLGRQHHLVVFEFPQSPPLTVYIDAQTKLISKMHRTMRNGTQVSYTFDRYRMHDDIPIASEHSVYVGAQRIYWSFKRSIVLDAAADRLAFRVEPDILEEPERIDQSMMSVSHLADGVIHVGQGESYSTFVETEHGHVVFGLKAGFEERLEAWRSHIGSDQTLSYAIIPDHRPAQIAGLEAAVQSGAQLVTTRDAISKFGADNGLQATDYDFVGVDALPESESLTLALVQTAHANEVIIGLASEGKIVLQSEHYAAPYKNDVFYAKNTGVTLSSAVQALGWKPSRITSTESRRAEDWSAFSTQVEAFQRVRCHRDRPICLDW